jgi:ectoine hydroxylase-related dioxygenase (phytanoyl-CoA dioxygenase family)
LEPEHLPDLTTGYDLTEDDIAAYRRDGHVLLRGVCSPDEIAAYQPIISAAAMRHNTQHLALDQRSTYGKAFLQITNIWEKDPQVCTFVFARRFAQIAARLMGVEAIRLYHDQALFKEGSGGLTPWHQDQGYWPLATDQTITMWMPLVDVTPDMGPMTFVSGSYHEGYLAPMPISDESEHYFDRLVRERGWHPTEPPGMAAGDATFHAGWTLHRASPNTTGKVREVMTVIYYADGMRVSAITKGNAGDLKGIFPGLQPGDIAASPLTPVLYRESTRR